VPSYVSAYRRAGIAENARIGARGVEVGIVVGRREPLAALRPTCRKIDAAIIDTARSSGFYPRSQGYVQRLESGE
jgi:hypothetical protein